MASPTVDTRKLKDQAAEFLGKSKFDKAAEILEQLARLEPKDMQHRLKLGDTYRRLGIEEKAIACYQTAGRQFGEDGQLIKAIGAFKVILEIDPKNQAAQQDLAQMNGRRFAKPATEPAQPKVAKGIGAGARGVSEMELAEGHKAVDQIGAMLEGTRGASAAAQVLPRPAPFARSRAPIELDAGPAEELELVPGPSARATPTSGTPAPVKGGSAPVPEKKSAPRVIALPPSDEIEIITEDDAPLRARAEIVGTPTIRDSSSARPAGAAARPIADLLAQDEDEIELLSVESDNVEAGPEEHEPLGLATTGEFEAVFSSLVPPKPVRLPAKVPLFDDLPQQAFVELVNRLSYKRWAPGEMILREGEAGRSFFVVVEGRVRVFKRLPDGAELVLATLGEGAFFGEMALLSGAARAANVVAEAETELFEISDDVLRETVARYPSVATSLKNFYRQRLVNNVMAISPLFRDFDPGERRAIVERFKMKQAAAGDVIIREAQAANGLFLILHGGVRVHKQVAGAREVELARLKEGEMFGEMSLLSNEPASATVTALSTTILLRLPPEDFQELILTHPQILEMVSELTDRRRSESAAVLSGHGPGHDGMSFV